jgi:hypothetical protein
VLFPVAEAQDSLQYGPETFSHSRPEPTAKIVDKAKVSPNKPVAPKSKIERPPVEEMYSAQPLKRKSEDARRLDRTDKAEKGEKVVKPEDKMRNTTVIDVGGIKMERPESSSKAEKRKAIDGLPVEGAAADGLERKKKKKNKDKDRVKEERRDPSPADSIASSTSRASGQIRPQNNQSRGSADHPPPPPPTSRPPDIPPPPPFSAAGPRAVVNASADPRPPPRLPPPPPPRKPEDVLFLKKKVGTDSS